MAQAGHTAYAVAEPGVDCVGIFGPEIEGGDREVVASVWIIDGDEDSAMKLARQFAAAPDLATELAYLLRWFDAAKPANAPDLTGPRAALSKAEGK